MKITTILTAAAITAAGLTTAAPAHADPMCSPHYWYNVCRNDDGSWMICGMSGPGCQPMINAGPTPLPGSTPAPGIGGSAYRTVLDDEAAEGVSR